MPARALTAPARALTVPARALTVPARAMTALARALTASARALTVPARAMTAPACANVGTPLSARIEGARPNERSRRAPHENCFAVWLDGRRVAIQSPVVIGTRIAPSGTVLDPGGILIGANPRSDQRGCSSSGSSGGGEETGSAWPLAALAAAVLIRRRRAVQPIRASS